MPPSDCTCKGLGIYRVSLTKNRKDYYPLIKCSCKPHWSQPIRGKIECILAHDCRGTTDFNVLVQWKRDMCAWVPYRFVAEELMTREVMWQRALGSTTELDLDDVDMANLCDGIDRLKMQDGGSSIRLCKWPRRLSIEEFAEFESCSIRAGGDEIGEQFLQRLPLCISELLLGPQPFSCERIIFSIPMTTTQPVIPNNDNMPIPSLCTPEMAQFIRQMVRNEDNTAWSDAFLARLGLIKGCCGVSMRCRDSKDGTTDGVSLIFPAVTDENGNISPELRLKTIDFIQIAMILLPVTIRVESRCRFFVPSAKRGCLLRGLDWNNLFESAVGGESEVEKWIHCHFPSCYWRYFRRDTGRFVAWMSDKKDAERFAITVLKASSFSFLFLTMPHEEEKKSSNVASVSCNSGSYEIAGYFATQAPDETVYGVTAVHVLQKQANGCRFRDLDYTPDLLDSRNITFHPPGFVNMPGSFFRGHPSSRMYDAVAFPVAAKKAPSLTTEPPTPQKFPFPSSADQFKAIADGLRGGEAGEQSLFVRNGSDEAEVCAAHIHVDTWTPCGGPYSQPMSNLILCGMKSSSCSVETICGGASYCTKEKKVVAVHRCTFVGWNYHMNDEDSGDVTVSKYAAATWLEPLFRSATHVTIDGYDL